MTAIHTALDFPLLKQEVPPEIRIITARGFQETQSPEEILFPETGIVLPIPTADPVSQGLEYIDILTRRNLPSVFGDSSIIRWQLHCINGTFKLKKNLFKRTKREKRWNSQKLISGTNPSCFFKCPLLLRLLSKAAAQLLESVNKSAPLSLVSPLNIHI